MKKRSWTEKQLINAVATSTSFRQVLHQLHLKETGGNYKQLQKYIKEYQLDIKHFKGKAWNKGLHVQIKPAIPLIEVLVKDRLFRSSHLRKRLIKEGLRFVKCEECGWNKVSEDGRLPLELDHMNGDPLDNRIENLRILCPNCHSLKPTHRGKNRKTKI